MGPGEHVIDADRYRTRAMSTEATPQTAVRALVFISPAHDLVAVRGTFSPTTSTLLVESSRIKMRGRVSSARAMAMRCFWPPLRVEPRSPTGVS